MPVHRSSLKNAPETPDIRVDVCVCSCMCVHVHVCICARQRPRFLLSSLPPPSAKAAEDKVLLSFAKYTVTGVGRQGEEHSLGHTASRAGPGRGRGWLSAPPHRRSPDEVTAARSRSSWRGLSRGQQQPSVTQRVTEEGPSEGGLPCSFSQKAPTRGSRVVVRAGDTVAACV